MAQIQVQGQNGSVNNGAGGGNNQFVPTSLYVGDLDSSVTEAQLYDYFAHVGPVLTVRVCKDLSTRRSLGYGYVNYGNPQDAARALDLLNFTLLNGKPIRIMYSNRDPSLRKSGAGNIFIKNLDKGIDHKALHDTFSAFGNILSCKVATDSSGQSKGYGFVQFDNEESAQKAIEQLNGMLMNDKQVYVGPFVRKQERDSAISNVKFNNVYVKNLSESTSDDDLKTIFGEFGLITSAVVMREPDGKSKGFGFVNFENTDDAARAVESLNGKKFDDKEWYVGKAQKKSERELDLKLQFEQSMKEAADKFQGANLYVKNLDDSISDEKLKELFSQYGTITSYKVMRDPSGISKGSGFVAFSTPEEASRALAEMNGKMVVSKPLYVAPAQRKEDRRARLQVCSIFSNATSYNVTFSRSSYANVPTWWSRSWAANILWSSTSGNVSAAWIWVSTAARPWYEAWWSSHAKFLCTNGSTRPTGSASRWQKGWGWSAKSATSSINAAADATARAGLSLSTRAWST
uniref:RRM domain-containing protein n=1 Tax=Gossypium raimondii TaxID=29730 RepID=A0A0D2VAK5_GOSRA|nr:hypothetical protein B456_013G046000 [Gossypium raimondii]